MILNYETILDIYTHKNKTILCQIKVQQHTKDNKQQQQCLESKNTCRYSLTREQWNTFDKELKNLIDGHNNQDGEVKWDKGNKFNVKPNIKVTVQKSKLSVNNFCDFFDVGAISVDGSVKLEETPDVKVESIKQVVYVLECILDLKSETLNSSKADLEYKPEFKISPDGKSNRPEKYEPYTPSKKTDRLKSIDTILTPGINVSNNKISSDSKSYSPDSYEPYSPSDKKYRLKSIDTIKTPGADFIGYSSNDDTYSPKPIVLSLKSVESINETSSAANPDYILPSKTKYQLKSTETMKTPSSDFIGYSANDDTYSPEPIVLSSKSANSISENSSAAKPDYNLESKIKYRLKSTDTVKSPGINFLGYTSNDDTYSPKPIAFSLKSGASISKNSIAIPEYKPAPIKSTHSLKDIPESCNSDTISEVIADELSNQKYRTKIKKSSKKVIEYIPKSYEISEAPAYIPTPIEDSKTKKEKQRSSNSKEKESKHNKRVSNTTEDNESKKNGAEIKEKITKLVYKEKERSKTKEKKNSHKGKEERLQKKSTDKTPLNSDFETAHKPIKLSPETKSEIETTNIQIKSSQESDLTTIKSSGAESSIIDGSPPKKKAKENHKKINRCEAVELERSEISSSKQKGLVEEQAKHESKTKTKTKKSSPHSKDLFGTDDEDDIVGLEKKKNIKNNNNVCAIKPHKSSPTKRKRRRISSECEQEMGDVVAFE